ANMTNRLLTFSRRQISHLKPLAVNQLVTEAVRLLQRVLPASICVEVHTDPQLKLVNAESTQLHQVIMNLVLNARDAMPQGGRLVLRTTNRELSVADCSGNVDFRPGKFVVLSVSDTGTGMTPEVQSRIFEPFFTTKPVGEGTGLGLSIVFGIVKAM